MPNLQLKTKKSVDAVALVHKYITNILYYYYNITTTFSRYPCASNKAEYNEAKVYSGSIYSNRFLFNDRCMVSTGGSDAALMLWELVDD